ncbi:MAG: serine hydrolase domain-containing protein [Brooklawnia sp.]|jgi:CubicO group peptidase (beta-lactamase class C family)
MVNTLTPWQPFGDEVDPEQAGVDPAGLTAALAEAGARGGHWQLVVWRGDQLLIDRASGDPGLCWLWSASKPFIALLTWQLVEAGTIDVDTPLATWWPEFAARGKQDITVRQVLQHRSGVPTGSGGQLADALVMHDWEWSTHRMAMSAPRWAPGERSAYHYLSYGFMLGELARRATGRELPELMDEQIFSPLGLGDLRLGLAADELGLAVPMDVEAPGGGLVEQLLNSDQVRQAVIPAAGIFGTARGLARFYRAMLGGGELDGVRVARPETIAQMRQQSSIDGEPDGLLLYPARWGQGFQLGGPAVGWPAVEPFGRLSSRDSFGHNGSNACTGWADPASGLVVAYIGNRMRGWQPDRMMLRRLADALHTAVSDESTSATAPRTPAEHDAPGRPGQE